MKENKNIKDDNFEWTFTKSNYLIFLIGIITIAFGYILMYSGSVNSSQSTFIAPLILVIGYCIIIPLSLLYK